MSALPAQLLYRAPEFGWYAVTVRRNFERVASGLLESKGYEQYVPFVRCRRRWSDRTKELEAPLFPGYVFCRFDPEHKVPILECTGVAGIVGFGNRPATIDEEEIRNIQTMLAACLHVEPYPFLHSGQKIRVEHGPLAGVEGVIVTVKNGFRLVASVTMLQRSVSVEIDREWVTPIPNTAR